MLLLGNQCPFTRDPLPYLNKQLMVAVSDSQTKLKPDKSRPLEKGEVLMDASIREQ